MTTPVTLRQVVDVEGVVRRRIAASAVLSVLGAIAVLAIPALAGTGVDELIGLDGESLPLILAAIAAFLLLRLFFDVTSRIFAGLGRHEVIATMRRQWFGEIVAIPPGSEGGTPSQEWVSILSYDIPRVGRMVVDLPLSLLRAAFMLIGIVVLMWMLQPLLTIGVLSLAPPAYFGARLAARRLRERARTHWNLEVEVMNRADEAFRGRWVVQAFNQEPRVAREFGRVVEDSRRAADAHLEFVSLIGPVTQFIAFSGMVGIVAFASWRELAIAPGELLSFVLYGLLLSQPLRALADGYALWHEADATVSRFEAVRNALAARAPRGTDAVADIEGRVELHDVTFSWRETPLLDQANLVIEPGEHVALVGPNGAGKTTLIALLLGFVDPKAGTITVDGVDLATLTDASRRSLFAVVPQQPMLLGRTVRACVTFGRPEATDGEILAALDAALAREVVDRLSEGLDTAVGEEGAQLSGGERQRLAVARALLLQSRIVVFDEPTASYDEEASATFVEQSRALLGGRTVLWVTHEEAPLVNVDRVIRLAAGKFCDELRSASGARAVSGA